MEAQGLTLTVISPDRILYQGRADSVVLPGVVGYFGVLPGHANLVAQLDFGLISLRHGSTEYKIAIDGGFCEVKQNQIRVLTEGGESTEDISASHAEELLQEATAMPSGKERDLLIKKAKTRILLHQH